MPSRTAAANDASSRSTSGPVGPKASSVTPPARAATARAWMLFRVTGPPALQERRARPRDDAAVTVAHRDHVALVHGPRTIALVVVRLEVGQPFTPAGQVRHRFAGKLPSAVHTGRVRRRQGLDDPGSGVVLAGLEHGAATQQRARVPLVGSRRGRDDHPVGELACVREPLRTHGREQERHVDRPRRRVAGRVDHPAPRAVDLDRVTPEEAAQLREVLGQVGPLHGLLAHRPRHR